VLRSGPSFSCGSASVPVARSTRLASKLFGNAHYLICALFPTLSTILPSSLRILITPRSGALRTAPYLFSW
jgi:hypothetical protein